MKHESRHNEEDNIEFLEKIPNVLQKNILGASKIDYGILMKTILTQAATVYW